eukprot:709801-Pyramimonas_sp.AAC.1
MPNAAVAPKWMARTTGEKDVTARRIAGPPGGGGQEARQAVQRGGKKSLDELVIVLAKLVLNDEAELRALIGAVSGTWLLSLDSRT